MPHSVKAAAFYKSFEHAFIQLSRSHFVYEIEKVLILAFLRAHFRHALRRLLTEVFNEHKPKAYRAVLYREAVSAFVYVRRQNLYFPAPAIRYYLRYLYAIATVAV